MKILGNILLTASVLAILAAVWAPGAWWQWLITAIVLLLAGAACAGNAENQAKAAKAAPQFDKGGPLPKSHLVRNTSGQPERITRPTHGKKDDL